MLISHRPLQPITTTLIKLVDSLIESEIEPEQEMKKRVKWIYEHTSEEVNCHLSTVELLVFRNIGKSVNREVEIGDKTFNISELYYILDNISNELAKIVITISKKYNFDMPIMNLGKGQSTQTIGFDSEEK